MSNKIIQLQPWRDRLLALTEQGEIYCLDLNLAGAKVEKATWMFGPLKVYGGLGDEFC